MYIYATFNLLIVDDYLSCFHNTAIVKKEQGVRCVYCMWVSFLQVYALNHVVLLFIVAWGPYLIFVAFALIHTPANRVYISPSIFRNRIDGFLDDSHSD